MMFDTVTVVCDPVTFEHGNAIRAILEVYRLQVHLVQLIQRGQAEAFFASPDPRCRYTVLDAHGSNKAPGMGIHISVVDQKDGDQQAAEGWDDSPRSANGRDPSPASSKPVLSCPAAQRVRGPRVILESARRAKLQIPDSISLAAWHCTGHKPRPLVATRGQSRAGWRRERRPLLAGVTNGGPWRPGRSPFPRSSAGSRSGSGR